eukprot:COSAG01_NODE_1901_length_8963_cov_106.596458_12_plen_113_part_00
MGQGSSRWGGVEQGVPRRPARGRPAAAAAGRAGRWPLAAASRSMAVSALLLRDSKKIQKLTCKVLLFAVYRRLRDRQSDASGVVRAHCCIASCMAQWLMAAALLLEILAGAA